LWKTIDASRDVSKWQALPSLHKPRKVQRNEAGDYVGGAIGCSAQRARQSFSIGTPEDGRDVMEDAKDEAWSPVG
jgi:hypothetical protein